MAFKIEIKSFSNADAALEFIADQLGCVTDIGLIDSTGKKLHVPMGDLTADIIEYNPDAVPE